MHPVFVESFKEMEAKFEKYTEQFSPYQLLRLAWDAFWSIRSTKTYENPINHLDIKAFMDTMRIDLTPNEVRLVLGWDRIYYKYIKQYQLM